MRAVSRKFVGPAKMARNVASARSARPCSHRPGACRRGRRCRSTAATRRGPCRPSRTLPIVSVAVTMMTPFVLAIIADTGCAAHADRLPRRRGSGAFDLGRQREQHAGHAGIGERLEVFVPVAGDGDVDPDLLSRRVEQIEFPVPRADPLDRLGDRKPPGRAVRVEPADVGDASDRDRGDDPWWLKEPGGSGPFAPSAGVCVAELISTVRTGRLVRAMKSGAQIYGARPMLSRPSATRLRNSSGRGRAAVTCPIVRSG